jgi:hypothetical protein
MEELKKLSEAPDLPGLESLKDSGVKTTDR